MEELIQHSPTEIAEYRRGTSLREVARGVLLRFLPASALSLFGLALGSPGRVAPLLGIVGGLLVPMALGFGLGLLALRKWLYPDAKVGGMRSVLVGLLAPLLPLAFFRFMAGSGLILQAWEMQAIFLLAGVAVALAMFFPWLTPTPQHMREDPDLRVDGGSTDKLIGGAPQDQL